MQKKSGLFVKINYNNYTLDKDKSVKEKNFSRSNDMNLKRYLLCAGILNKNGGTFIFQAKNMDEAEDIGNNNPFINSKIYSYEILKSDIINL